MSNIAPPPVWGFVLGALITIILLIIKCRQCLKAVQHYDAAANNDRRPSVVTRTVRQTYMISPVYTIDTNRNGNNSAAVVGDLHPHSYERAIQMPHSGGYDNKAYHNADDGLPTYDEAIVYSQEIDRPIVVPVAEAPPLYTPHSTTTAPINSISSNV